MINTDEFNNIVEKAEKDDIIVKTETKEKDVQEENKNTEKNENPQIKTSNKKESQKENNEPQSLGIGQGSPLVLNLQEIDSNNKVLENSEVLLAIYEVATNSTYYGLNMSNKSRAFWEKLSELDCFKKVLNSFKTETLRKYWRLLNEIPNQKKVLETIKRNIEVINNTQMKVLTIITVLKDYCTGKITDLAKVLSEPQEKINGGEVKRRTYKKDDEDDSFELEKPKKPLNKKRADAETEKLFQDINAKAELANTVVVDGIVQEGRRSTRAKPKASVFTDEDKRVFVEIEEIVNTFKSVIPEVTDVEIWDALKRNSFNIESTYLYLNEPEVYEGK